MNHFNPQKNLLCILSIVLFFVLLLGDHIVWLFLPRNPNDNYTIMKESEKIEEEKKENTFGANPNIWSGKIGLISPSDYGYATSGGATIDRNICLNTELSKLSEKSECIANNWLFIANKSQWFLTASLQNGEKYWTINEAGDLEEQNANSAYADRPTLYLKAGLTVKSGNGTPGNPYIIF